MVTNEAYELEHPDGTPDQYPEMLATSRGTISNQLDIHKSMYNFNFINKKKFVLASSSYQLVHSTLKPRTSSFMAHHSTHS